MLWPIALWLLGLITGATGSERRLAETISIVIVMIVYHNMVAFQISFFVFLVDFAFVKEKWFDFD